jgi:hypothetical protein
MQGPEFQATRLPDQKKKELQKKSTINSIFNHKRLFNTSTTFFNICSFYLFNMCNITNDKATKNY